MTWRVAWVPLWILTVVLVEAKFDCPALPPLARPARTVHELRPQDIKVVMALGDSVTAGTQEGPDPISLIAS
jgi:phospholipase B1